jgi:hypothetical protein
MVGHHPGAERGGRVDDRNKHLGRPVEQPIGVRARVEEDRANHAERRHLDGNVVGHLVHAVGDLLRLALRRKRRLARHDQDQVIRVDRLEARHRLEWRASVDRRPADVRERDRLAPIDRVRQPSVDLHRADEPPFFGHPVEGDPALARTRRRAVCRAPLGLALPSPQEVERHPLFLRCA